jgi:hypothetical protein
MKRKLSWASIGALALVLRFGGASGASGDQDEAAVVYGIEQAGLVADLPK